MLAHSCPANAYRGDGRSDASVGAEVTAIDQISIPSAPPTTLQAIHRDRYSHRAPRRYRYHADHSRNCSIDNMPPDMKTLRHRSCCNCRSMRVAAARAAVAPAAARVVAAPVAVARAAAVQAVASAVLAANREPANLRRRRLSHCVVANTNLRSDPKLADWPRLLMRQLVRNLCPDRFAG